MSSGGLRFRKNSLEPRNSLESLRTAQGLPCDAVDLLWYEIRCENSSQHHWLMIILLWHRFASAQKKKCCSAQDVPIKLWLRSLAFSIIILNKFERIVIWHINKWGTDLSSWNLYRCTRPCHRWEVLSWFCDVYVEFTRIVRWTPNATAASICACVTLSPHRQQTLGCLKKHNRMR